MSGRPGGPRGFWVVPLFLAVVLLLYHGALGLGFLSDDWYFIRAGVVRPWSALLLPPRDVADPQSYHYVPLGQLAYVLEHAAFGLHPRPWHLVNLGLHALNAFLVFRLCRDGLGARASTSVAAGLAFAVLFFHYESVLFVAGIFYLLAAVSLLAALLSFAAFLRRGGPGRYVAYVAWSLAAVLAIEGGLVVVPLAALTEIMAPDPAPLRRRLWRAVRHQLPALLVVGGYVLLRAAGARTRMNEVPPIKVVGTAVYSIFGLLSFNLPPLYELYFDHKRLAAAILAVVLAVLLARGGRLVRLATLGFVIAFSIHYLLSGFETRYFYLPGVFAALLLAAVLEKIPWPAAVAGWGPSAAVLLTAVMGQGYRADRIGEWRLASEITARTLAEVCPPASRWSRADRVVVVDAPDSVGRLWGTSFPAYVFRNGLSEAAALCRGTPSRAWDLEFVASGQAASYNVKAARTLGPDEIPPAGLGTAELRYDPSDARRVSLTPP